MVIVNLLALLLNLAAVWLLWGSSDVIVQSVLILNIIFAIANFIAFVVILSIKTN